MATYTIYASQLEEVQKKLDRLAKKAEGFSIPFSYSIGEEHPATVRVMDYDGVNHFLYTASRYKVAAVDIEIECDGLIKANGWTVRAKIEHLENGNVVTGFGDKPVDPAWFTVHAHCDHCKTNRFRSVTFFCENEAGELRQVGSTCLKDYTGISPATAAMWAEVKDLLDTGMDCMPEEWERLQVGRMYDLLTVLGHACDAIRKFGYRKADYPESTRDMTIDKVLGGEAPSEEGMKNAAIIRDWLVGLDAAVKQGSEMVSDLERSCIPLALSGFAAKKHFGRLAYMPLAYERYKERKAREERYEAERSAAAAASDFVGAVGQRITILTATAKLVTSWDGYYGTTFLYKFTDVKGNVYVWRSSKYIEIQDRMTVKGSVKEHSEYDGVKQTVITRCAVA